MTQDNFTQDHVMISFSDVMLVLRRSKFKLACWIVFFGAVVGLYVLTRPPLFMAESSFREKSKIQTETSKSLSLALILGNQEGSENAAISLLKSRKLVSRVILDRGLQAQVNKSGFSYSWLRNIYSNLIVEWAALTKSKEPSLIESLPPFTVKDIQYAEEIPLNLHIHFISEDTFKVLDKRFQEIGKGQMGLPFKGANFLFTVVRRNKEALIGEQYDLKLIPMEAKADELIKNIEVKSDAGDKSLLRLTFYHQSRVEASAILNDLTTVYIDYLKAEQKRIAEEQISYLHRRQKEEALKLKKIMEEHALAISSNMMTMESLFSTQQTYAQRLLLIDLELERLKRAHEEGLVYYDKYADGADTGVINHILSEIRAYKQQADSIDVALRQIQPEDAAVKSAMFAKQMDEIEGIQKNSKEAKNILAALEEGKPLPPEGPLVQNPRYNIKDWVQIYRQALQKPSKECKDDCEKKFKAYLANMLHLFDVEEKLVNERVTHQQNIQLEFQGIDLPTANQIYINYSKNLSDIESEILHHQFIIDQMHDQAFEPSSLSSFLVDPVSQDIIVKASDLVLRFKDQLNRTQRELDRIKEDLDQQRNFLLMHVKQMLQLLQLREKLYKEKILSLQNTQLELIHQKISVLEKHLSDYISSRINNFKQEKSSIEQQQLSLKFEMEKMPNKWASEKLIDLHLDMSRKMIEEITKLVESKNISTHLDITQSAPLDKAMPPIHPQNSKLILFMFLGSLLGSLLCCGFIMMKIVYKGIPATEQNLRMLGYYVAGKLSKNSKHNNVLPETNLEILRRLAAHITMKRNGMKEGLSLLLMVSKGVDYSHQFSLLLARSGYRILYMTISGDHRPNETATPGLFQYLEGKASSYQICKESGWDTIPSGEIPQFANELLTGNRFKELIQKLKVEYDWIIFVSKSSPLTGEAENLLNLFDLAVITVTDESVQDLLAYHQKQNISFIVN